LTVSSADADAAPSTVAAPSSNENNFIFIFDPPWFVWLWHHAFAGANPAVREFRAGLIVRFLWCGFIGPLP
jgi:hypothetical protein